MKYLPFACLSIPAFIACLANHDVASGMPISFIWTAPSKPTVSFGTENIKRFAIRSELLRLLLYALEKLFAFTVQHHRLTTWFTVLIEYKINQTGYTEWYDCSQQSFSCEGQELPPKQTVFSSRRLCFRAQ